MLFLALAVSSIAIPHTRLRAANSAETAENSADLAQILAADDGFGWQGSPRASQPTDELEYELAAPGNATFFRLEAGE